MSIRDRLVHRRTLLIGMAATLASTAVPAWAAKVNLTSQGVAIKGYDPVAYFAQGAAVKGTSSNFATHEGATYHFASAANRDAFVADPARFAPAYGGFCAYAAAKGYIAQIDPAAFSVVDDRLFLNYSKGVRTRWEKDIPGHIASADANWPTLSAQ